MPGLAVWEPTLDGVARHIPRRTRDSTTPGQAKTLGTFTETTTPTAGQAQEYIDAAVRGILGQTGAIPADPDLEAMARDAAEWQAAADIEIAYPNRDADVNVAQVLLARAQAAFTRLVTALTASGGGEVALVPTWSFPDPPWYGDIDL